MHAHIHDVESLRFDVPFADLPDFRADAVLGSSVIEVLKDLRDVRQLRDSLINLARYVAKYQNGRGVLLLDAPQVSAERVRKEWSYLIDVFHPGILNRLGIAKFATFQAHPIIGHLTGEEQEHLLEIIEHERSGEAGSVKRPAEVFYDVLRVLLVHYFRRLGALSLKSLGEQAGCTYPTLAKGLAKLEPWIIRHSNRSVELGSFPQEPVLQMFGQSAKIRSTQGYGNASARPRSNEMLLDRLWRLQRGVAIGGVLGSRHYFPGLDLAGTPRLDLVVHARPEMSRDEHDFIRHMDAALKPVKRGEPPQVVVHTLYRPESLFQTDERGVIWADEVECLMDLHEMRLEAQAVEFIDHLIKK